MYFTGRNRTNDKQNGMALIEALIAIFLFSLGVLALVGLQALMNKNVTHAKLRGEAAFLANQLIGQMWVDQVNLPNYAMVDSECTGGGDLAKCTNWGNLVGQVLPSGTAEVTVNGSDVAITLGWQLPGESAGRFEIGANINN